MAKCPKCGEVIHHLVIKCILRTRVRYSKYDDSEEYLEWMDGYTGAILGGEDEFICPKCEELITGNYEEALNLLRPEHEDGD